MRNFVTPKVVVSRCIEFGHCRYNGLIVSSDFVKELKPYVEFIPVCPEYEVGLGVPRDPIIIVSTKEGMKLFQPATGRDLTEQINGFASSFLDSLEGVDGFILKAKSPSCGIKTTKIYSDRGGELSISGSGNGLFGNAVLDRFSNLAIEDEGRLIHPRIREYFLNRIFTNASFRKVKESGSINELVRFHTQNKFLLMAYNQQELRKMGNIVANHEKRPFSEVAEEYSIHLSRALSKPPTYTSIINVILHSLGYFSDDLTHEEKGLLMDYI